MTNIKFLQSEIIISGDFIISEISEIGDKLLSFVRKYQGRGLTINISAVDRIDSSGVALLDELGSIAENKSFNLVIYGESEHIRETRKIFSSESVYLEKRERFSFFYIIGEKVEETWQNIKDAFILTADAFFYAATGLVKKQGMRKGEFQNQCMLLGMNSLPIVTILGFLIGFILALQSAAQLRQFGAGIYIADLIAISMTREMGPIMTAIVFAGRSGSSITAEIATMVVTEETDALKAMGLSPVKYVLVPKIYAMTVSVPLLTAYSMVIGILGAMLVGVTYLDLGVEPFYNQVLHALIIKDVITGLVKSVVFAWIIVMVGAHFGFRVKGGAEGVGKATTASVVVSIFLVILADSILGLIFYFGKGIEF
ncbi:MlaE family lipid ABC transporter permease subunit [bacterium]|nr:MlaE family lipid ABC transporter permease subunit [bacterium]